MSDEHAVMATLEDYAAAYCAKDVDRLMALFNDSEDISLIGTGADELCAGRAQVRSIFERNFAEATATKFDWHWKHISIARESAVVAISLTIHLDTDDGQIEVPIRWTVSLIQRDGKWRWVHRHASSAAGSQADGAAYPTGSVHNK